MYNNYCYSLGDLLFGRIASLGFSYLLRQSDNSWGGTIKRLDLVVITRKVYKRLDEEKLSSSSLKGIIRGIKIYKEEYKKWEKGWNDTFISLILLFDQIYPCIRHLT